MERAAIKSALEEYFMQEIIIKIELESITAKAETQNYKTKKVDDLSGKSELEIFIIQNFNAEEQIP